MFDTDEARNAALRNWARDDRHCEAAVELLIDHGHWPAMLDNADLLTRWNDNKAYARPMLAVALRRLDDPNEHEMFASSSEEKVLEIAASLVEGAPIKLSYVLTGLDRGNQKRVTEAVMRAVGLIGSLS